MRGATAVLALLLGACSTAGGDTATTAPVGESSTTSTTSPSTTTTTEPTTTTTEEECTERDGIQRTRRGFICPPTMSEFDLAGAPAQHLEGTYTTRQFLPAFTFSTTSALSTRGAGTGVVEFDYRSPSGGAIPKEAFRIYSSETASRLIPRVYERNAEDPRAETITLDEIEFWGYPAEQLEFTLGSECPADEGCNLGVEGWPSVTHFVWNTTHRVRFVIVDVPGGPVGIEVFNLRTDFDTYWAEVALPILDSIEFLDR